MKKFESKLFFFAEPFAFYLYGESPCWPFTFKFLERRFAWCKITTQLALTQYLREFLRSLITIVT